MAVLLREKQIPYVHSALNKLEYRDKGILSFPCGFGKTHIMCKLIEQKEFDKVLIFCPTNILLYQTEERVKKLLGIKTFIVSSKNIKSRHSVQIEKEMFYNEKLIVLSTYASKKLLSDIQFDCVFYDEAHRISNEIRLSQQRNDIYGMSIGIESKYKIFLTATPTGVLIDKFGILEFCSLQSAIEKNVLKPFEVICFLEKEEEGCTEKDCLRNAVEFLKSENKRKCISFSRTNLNAEYCSRLFRKIPNVKSEYIHNFENDNDIKLFFDSEPDKLKVIANCKKLAEGYDISSVDSVIFCDTVCSKIFLTQSIGRAIRQDGCKRPALIIMPITLKEDHFGNLTVSESYLKRYDKMIDLMKDIDSENIFFASNTRKGIVKSKNINIDKHQSYKDINKLLESDEEFTDIILETVKIKRVNNFPRIKPPRILDMQDVYKNVWSIKNSEYCEHPEKCTYMTRVHCDHCKSKRDVMRHIIAIYPDLRIKMQNNVLERICDADVVIPNAVDNYIKYIRNNKDFSYDEKLDKIKEFFKVQNDKGMLYFYDEEESKLINF